VLYVESCSVRIITILILYWHIYSYINMRQNLFRNCYRITKKKKKKKEKQKTKNLAVSFNRTFRYIDHVLSINNHKFHKYVHLIYPDELEIKDTTESDKSASYLDILRNIDSNGRQTTSLYDKRDDFDFAIVNFPFLCSNIPL
jgi:hypothetical protein